MSSRPLSKNFSLPPRSMKTAKSLNFKRIGSFKLIWYRFSCLWNWNWLKVVLRKLTRPRRLKGAQGWIKRRRSRRFDRLGNAVRYSSPLDTHLNKILRSIFSKKNYIYKDVYQNLQIDNWSAQILLFQQLWRSFFWIRGSFELRSLWLWRSSSCRYGSTCLLTFAFKVQSKESKNFVDSKVWKFIGELRVDFPSLQICSIQLWLFFRFQHHQELITNTNSKHELQVCTEKRNTRSFSCKQKIQLLPLFETL